MSSKVTNSNTSLIPIPRLYYTNKNRKPNPLINGKFLLKGNQDIPKQIQLIPIRIDFEIDGYKIRDTFTWNLYESTLTPEHFAQILIDDLFETAPSSSQSIISQISSTIRSQCQNYQNVAQIEDEDQSENNQEMNDWRTIVKLDLQVGPLHLNDQFEWPVMPVHNSITSDQLQVFPTPETYAKQLCSDLGIGGEFVSLIAHSIHEQLCLARLDFDDSEHSNKIPNPPFRNNDDDWTPKIEILSEEEIQQRLREHERSSRRLRRTQRGGPNPIVINRVLDDDDYGRRTTRSQQSSIKTPDKMNYHPYAMSYSNSSNYGLDYNDRYFNKNIPYKNFKPNKEEAEVILKKLEETINLKNLPPAKTPPKTHRGFGASANRFNETGDIEVGEFREKWRCAWCLLSGKFTPTLRKGPMGSKTLCNACGIWYGKHGNLPKERFREHEND